MCRVAVNPETLIPRIVVVPNFLSKPASDRSKMRQSHVRTRPLRTGVAATSVIALLLTPQGAGFAQTQAQDSTTVSDIVVRTPEVAVPTVGEGAPLYTVEELEGIQTQARREAQSSYREALDCDERAGINEGNYLREYQSAAATRDTAEQAMAATRQAQDVRRAAAAGRATPQEVEAAELARQTAVNRVVAARTAFADAQATTARLQKLRRDNPEMPAEDFKLMARSEIAAGLQERAFSAGQRTRPIPPQFATLALENITVGNHEDDKGAALMVSGTIRNKGQRRVPTPPLEITAVDSFGIPLKREVADARGSGPLDPGEIQRFAYPLRPPPGNAAKVVVSFGSDEFEPWRMPQSAGRAYGVSFCFNIELMGRPNTTEAATTVPRLTFENLTVRTAVENGVRSLTVSGTIRNVATTPAQVPVFGIVLFDQDNAPFSTVRVETDGRPVPARGTKPFSLTLALTGDTRVSRAAVVPNLSQTAAR